MTTLRQTARRQVDQFLSALFLPEELIELRFIESWLSQGKKRSRVVRAAQWLQRADVIAMHAESHGSSPNARGPTSTSESAHAPTRVTPTTAASRRFAASGATSTDVTPDEARSTMDGGGHSPAVDRRQQRFGNPRLLAA